MDPISILLSIGSKLFQTLVPSAQIAVANKLGQSDSAVARDIGNLIQREAEQIKSLLNAIKMQQFEGALISLTNAGIAFANPKMDTVEKNELTASYLAEAVKRIEVVIASLTEKNESGPRMSCAKIGVFYYLFRRFYLGKHTEDTLSHCLTYVRLALNAHGTSMVNEVLYPSSMPVLLRGNEALKQEVYDGMKNMLGVIFNLLHPSPSLHIPFWEILIDGPLRPGQEEQRDKRLDFIIAGDYLVTREYGEVLVWEGEEQLQAVMEGNEELVVAYTAKGKYKHKLEPGHSAGCMEWRNGVLVISSSNYTLSPPKPLLSEHVLRYSIWDIESGTLCYKATAKEERGRWSTLCKASIEKGGTRLELQPPVTCATGEFAVCLTYMAHISTISGEAHVWNVDSGVCRRISCDTLAMAMNFWQNSFVTMSASVIGSISMKQYDLANGKCTFNTRVPGKEPKELLQVGGNWICRTTTGFSVEEQNVFLINKTSGANRLLCTGKFPNVKVDKDWNIVISFRDGTTLTTNPCTNQSFALKLM